jgi:hypothetical protein
VDELEIRPPRGPAAGFDIGEFVGFHGTFPERVDGFERISGQELRPPAGPPRGTIAALD